MYTIWDHHSTVYCCRPHRKDDVSGFVLPSNFAPPSTTHTHTFTHTRRAWLFQDEVEEEEKVWNSCASRAGRRWRLYMCAVCSISASHIYVMGLCLIGVGWYWALSDLFFLLFLNLFTFFCCWWFACRFRFASQHNTYTRSLNNICVWSMRMQMWVFLLRRSDGGCFLRSGRDY